MDFVELKNNTERELHDLLAEKRDELRELKFKAHENQLKKVTDIAKTRKVIAQILTLLNTKSAPASTVPTKKVETKDASVDKKTK